MQRSYPCRRAKRSPSFRRYLRRYRRHGSGTGYWGGPRKISGGNKRGYRKRDRHRTVRYRGPFQIVDNEEIKVAVVVKVEPAPSNRPDVTPNPCFGRYVFEFPVSKIAVWERSVRVRSNLTLSLC